MGSLGGSGRDPPVLAPGWEHSAGLDGFRARGAALLARLFDGAAIACWKDPRTSILLPFWKTVVPVIATILVYRDPREVAESLARRNGIDPEHTAYLWLRYVVGAWRNDPDNLRVEYARFFDDLDHRVNLICHFLRLAYPTPEVRAAIRDLVDPSLRRSMTADDGGPMMARALELFRLLEGPADEVHITIERLAASGLRTPIPGHSRVG